MQKCKLIQKNMTVRKKKKYISNLKIKNKKGIFTKKKIKNAKSKLYLFPKQIHHSQKKYRYLFL